MKKFFFKVFLLVAIISAQAVSFLGISTAAGEEAKNGKIFYLVLINGISVSDLARYETPNMKRLMDKGAVAALSSRSLCRQSVASTYLSINTSNYARCEADCEQGLNFGEVMPDGMSADGAFEKLTGKKPAPYNVFNFFMKRKTFEGRRNIKFMYPARIGLLGDTLAAAGVKVLVFGNADYFDSGTRKISREVSLVGMGADGITQMGFVSPRLLYRDSKRPSGAYMDAELLVSVSLLAMDIGEPALVITEFSDFQRDDMNSYMSPVEFEQIKKESFSRFDWVLGEMMNAVDARGDRLMLALPRVGSLQQGEDGMVALYGPGIRNGSFLTSQTTHRQGFVSLIDISPTIMSYFDIKPPEKTYGNAMAPSGKGRPDIGVLARKIINIASTDSTRPIFFYVFCIAGAALVGVWLLAARPASRNLRVHTRGLIYLFLLLPLFTCLPSFFPYFDFYEAFAASIAVSAAAALIMVIMFSDWEKPAVICACLFPIALFADLLTGSRMPLNSVFGYSTHFAGRFFGIGNIQMAELIGCVCVTIGYLAGRKNISRAKKAAAALAGGVLCCVALSPALGANLGGIITAFFTFGLLAALYLGVKFTIKTVATAAVIFTAAFSALLLLPSLMPGIPQSHISGFANKIVSGNFSYVLSILRTKIILLSSSFALFYWDILFAVMIIIPIICYRRRKKEVNDFLIANKDFHIAGKALFYGGLVGFIFNDSGVSVPCNLWLPWLFVFLLKFDRQKNE